jgi:L,D-peptidoglycan transpeptidase YkuD (ErfK/YbiS/YcfS/YnhG family)
VPVALGRSGIARGKREGDGHTPAGAFRLLSVLYRPDRGPRPRTALPVTAITPDMGWCDDPADRNYNHPVTLPYSGRHERLWRDDRLYDLVVVVDYNMHPVVRGAGSAIFLHVARDDFGPTEGCVAMAPQAMRRLLRQVSTDTIVEIG